MAGIMYAKRAGACGDCGKAFRQNDPIRWYPKIGALCPVPCVPNASRKAAPAPMPPPPASEPRYAPRPGRQVAPVYVPTVPREAPRAHAKDTDCTVGADGFCVDCNVHHGPPCHLCRGRGYHAGTCPDRDAPRCDDLACRGWCHMQNGIERCDTCQRYPDDSAARTAHAKECGCTAFDDEPNPAPVDNDPFAAGIAAARALLARTLEST